MVDNVTDDKLTASSSFIGRSITKTPDMAKLSSKGWSPNLDDTYPWIQVFLCFCKLIKCEKKVKVKVKTRFNMQLENKENMLLHKI